jgi:acetyltransferase-like isoleucine patch superfamily enzyme
VRLEHDWYPADVPENVSIGPRSWLYSSYAFLHYRSRTERGVVIGSDSGVYNGSFFELGPRGHVTIGNYCSIVGAKIMTNRAVTIGDYCFIAHEVVISDSAYAVPPADGEDGNPAKAGVTIEDNVWIGAGAILLGGAHVGAGSIIGAAAVVDFEVRPNSIILGNPGRLVGFSTAE